MNDKCGTFICLFFKTYKIRERREIKNLFTRIIMLNKPTD